MLDLVTELNSVYVMLGEVWPGYVMLGRVTSC